MFFFLLSNIIGSGVSISTLPLPLYSTLQVAALISNAALATIILKEKFTRRTAVGTGLTIVGAIFISVYSSEAVVETSHTLDELLALLSRKGFVIWMSLSMFVVIMVILLIFSMSYMTPAHKRQSAGMKMTIGLSFGFISGLLSAHTLLLAKSAVELLVRSIIHRENQFNRPQSWILLIVFGSMALIQLYFLHRGLKLVTTSILYPLCFCIYNITAILDGLIYFRQTDRLTWLDAGFIALGTIILLAGVLALSLRLDDEHQGGLISDDASIPELPGGREEDSIHPSQPSELIRYTDEPNDSYKDAVDDLEPIGQKISLVDNVSTITEFPSFSLLSSQVSPTLDTDGRLLDEVDEDDGKQRHHSGRRNTLKEMEVVFEELGNK